jgi:outer membrane protein OmpA-like peptidoglycan-associated protein
MTEVHVASLDALARTVYFDTGMTTFKSNTYEVLDKIVALLKKFPAEKFTIEGHTDSVGSTKSNHDLSHNRANAVKTYLSTKVGNTFTASGQGELKPIASNNTRAGRTQNRRVEIKLVK